MPHAAPALVAGAALLLSACGGVLGEQASEAVKALAPVACAIEKATNEDSNYAGALTDRTNGFPFAGRPEDDLARPAVRRRVFRARLDELRAVGRTLAKIEPEGRDDLGRGLVAAARHDLRGATALMAFDLRYAPGDPKAPSGPTEVPSDLSDLISRSSPQVRDAFADCRLPDDQARRLRLYAG